MLLEGVPLRQIMTRAYWKHPAMAMHYIKLLKVLGPFTHDLSSMSPADYERLNTLLLEEQTKNLQAYPWFARQK